MARWNFEERQRILGSTTGGGLDEMPATAADIDFDEWVHDPYSGSQVNSEPCNDAVNSSTGDASGGILRDAAATPLKETQALDGGFGGNFTFPQEISVPVQPSGEMVWWTPGDCAEIRWNAAQQQYHIPQAFVDDFGGSFDLPPQNVGNTEPFCVHFNASIPNGNLGMLTNAAVVDPYQTQALDRDLGGAVEIPQFATPQQAPPQAFGHINHNVNPGMPAANQPPQARVRPGMIPPRNGVGYTWALNRHKQYCEENNATGCKEDCWFKSHFRDYYDRMLKFVNVPRDPAEPRGPKKQVMELYAFNYKGDKKPRRRK